VDLVHFDEKLIQEEIPCREWGSAGKAQGNLKHGRRLQCKNGTTIRNACVTIAQQLGVEMNRFSNSTGTISGLFS